MWQSHAVTEMSIQSKIARYSISGFGNMRIMVVGWYVGGNGIGNIYSYEMRWFDNNTALCLAFCKRYYRKNRK